MNKPANPTNSYTVPPVAIAIGRTGVCDGLMSVDCGVGCQIVKTTQGRWPAGEI